MNKIEHAKNVAVLSDHIDYLREIAADYKLLALGDTNRELLTEHCRRSAVFTVRADEAQQDLDALLATVVTA